MQLRKSITTVHYIATYSMHQVTNSMRTRVALHTSQELAKCTCTYTLQCFHPLCLCIEEEKRRHQCQSLGKQTTICSGMTILSQISTLLQVFHWQPQCQHSFTHAYGSCIPSGSKPLSTFEGCNCIWLTRLYPAVLPALTPIVYVMPQVRLVTLYINCEYEILRTTT